MIINRMKCMKAKDFYIANSAESMLDLTPRVQELCRPLFANFRITFYKYVEIDQNGESVLLMSDKNVYRDAIDFDLLGYDKTNLSFITFPKPGCYLHDLMIINRPDLQCLNESLENNGHGHLFTILEIKYDKIMPKLHRHTFGVQLSDNIKSNQHYLKEFNILKMFGNYFINNISKIKERIKPFKSTLDMKSKDKVVRKVNNMFKMNKCGNPFEHDSGSISTKLIKLSKRQSEILYWYINGKTASETGKLLNLSQRTVENHFFVLKNKFSCSTKHQLLIKLFENGLIHL